jgi:adenylate kinase family enzyme
VADNSDLGRKVLVAGQGGKSTLARALAADLGLPYIELDSIFWMANWMERDRADFRSRVQTVMDENPGSWVIDGNYASALDGLVAKQAETIVYVNMPWRVMYWRILWRSLRRSWTGEVLWHGNKERWRDSLLWTLLTRRKRFIGGRTERLREWSVGGRLIELDGGLALDRFYEERGLVRE